MGVESDASFAEIKLAYRKLARSTHPDVNPNSAERFRRVNAAYALLSDDNRRALFDRGNDWAVRLTREQTRTHFHTHKANASRAGPPRNTTIRWPKNALGKFWGRLGKVLGKLWGKLLESFGKA